MSYFDKINYMNREDVSREIKLLQRAMDKLKERSRQLANPKVKLKEIERPDLEILKS